MIVKYIRYTISLAIAVITFLFYSSASYSAFFKDFTPDDDKITSTTIFDAQAIPKAFADGLAEVIFIVWVSFVFLAFAFIIHKLRRVKTKSAIATIIALVLITLLFNAILAYGIIQEIYKLQQFVSANDIEPDSISKASENLDFWAIILLGIVLLLSLAWVFPSKKQFINTKK